MMMDIIDNTRNQPAPNTIRSGMKADSQSRDTSFLDTDARIKQSLNDLFRDEQNAPLEIYASSIRDVMQSKDEVRLPAIFSGLGSNWKELFHSLLNMETREIALTDEQRLSLKTEIKRLTADHCNRIRQQILQSLTDSASSEVKERANKEPLHSTSQERGGPETGSKPDQITSPIASRQQVDRPSASISPRKRPTLVRDSRSPSSLARSQRSLKQKSPARKQVVSNGNSNTSAGREQSKRDAMQKSKSERSVLEEESSIETRVQSHVQTMPSRSMMMKKSVSARTGFTKDQRNKQGQ